MFNVQSSMVNVQCHDFWSKKRSSKSCILEREIAQNSAFVQPFWCLQDVGTGFQGPQSYAFTPSTQWNVYFVTVSWESRNSEFWGATLRVTLQNWHLRILQNGTWWAKLVVISELLKPQNTRIFGTEGDLARKYAILQRVFVGYFHCFFYPQAYH